MTKTLSGIAAQKSELRTRLRSIRSSLSDEEYAVSSEGICQHLLSVPVLSSATWIHSFWPLIQTREPDIRPFLENLIHMSVRIALPVIRPELDSGPSRPHIRQIEYHNGSSMMQNRWGILEPEGELYVSRKDIDVAIVPALGVDRSGFRIGYGGGYYDEFLSGMNVTIVCPIFSKNIIESAPREGHDIPVDFIVTEAGCFATDKT